MVFLEFFFRFQLLQRFLVVVVDIPYNSFFKYRSKACHCSNYSLDVYFYVNHRERCIDMVAGRTSSETLRVVAFLIIQGGILV